MRLAASNLAWSRADDERAADVLASAGVTGVELAPAKVWRAPLEEPPQSVHDYEAWWQERGFEIVALQALLYGHPDLVLFGDEAAREALLARLGGMARLAEQLGASVLVFGAPANRRRGDLSPQAALEMAVPFFRQAGGVCAEHGVVLCVEPNPRVYGCDFVTSVREALELVLLADSPGLGLQLDSAALTLAGDDPAQLIAAAPTLRHFHVSEPNLAPPGSGAVDHDTLGRVLAEAGYAGWRSVEMADAGLEALARALPLVADCYGGTERRAA